MNSKITFPRLATLLADKSGRSKRFSEDFLREFFLLISETLEKGDSIKVKGLGSFRLSRVEPRKSVDVTTGLAMEIPGHSKVTFTPAKELAETINSPFEAFSAVEIADDIELDNLFTDESLQIEEDNNDNSEAVGEENLIINEADAADSADLITSETSKESGEERVTEYIEESPQEIAFEEEKAFDADTAYEEEKAFEEERAFDADTAFDNDKSYESDQNLALEELEEEEESSDQYDHCPANLHSHENNESPEEEEQYESKPKPTRSNIKRSLLIIGGAALLGLILTFGIWYFISSHNLKKSMKEYSGINHEEYPTVGSIFNRTDESNEIQETPDDNGTQTEGSEEMSEIEVSETESVPTNPSDKIVYDTISTTRYLTTMAKEHYGNFNLWPYIYEENKNILGHPDRIRPGTPVVVPKLTKYGVDPYNSSDIEKAKQLGIEIYARYGKKI